MTSRPIALALAACALFAAPLTRADTPPNPWDAIANPALADRFALHLRVRELMTSARSAEGTHDSSIALGLRNRARMFLEEGHADTSPDLVLRFDLGEVCYDLEDNDCAIRVLEPALLQRARQEDIGGVPASDQPAALDAYVALADAYAKEDRSVDERRIYSRYLPRITDDRLRAIAMLNLAEANMHVGDLDDAIAGYRETINAAAQLPNVIELEQHTGMLARWGLAVALDRSGDVTGGAKETKLAIQLDTDMHEIRGGVNVFFSPERERYWYVALGFAEYAKTAADAKTAALLWNRSEECWREYVDDVRRKSTTDRWIDLARARLEKTHAQRVVAERRVRGRIAYPQYDCVR